MPETEFIFIDWLERSWTFIDVNSPHDTILTGVFDEPDYASVRMSLAPYGVSPGRALVPQVNDISVCPARRTHMHTDDLNRVNDV